MIDMVCCCFSGHNKKVKGQWFPKTKGPCKEDKAPGKLHQKYVPDQRQRVLQQWHQKEERSPIVY